jgi:tRNA uridine 5-carboxymethylaminomethyl modification enzyme
VSSPTVPHVQIAERPLFPKPPPPLADVVVIGGGHAGCEAAAAAARAGARTVLLTTDAVRIGEMSCNPAIGGLGKGHIVREIDALDGVMGRVADHAGIQFRLLNRSKGPAVRGPRAQADRALYRSGMRSLLAGLDRLAVVEGHATALLTDGGRCVGVALADGSAIRAAAVVLTTGTFLNGMIHLGARSWQAGRMGEQATTDLAAQLRELGLPMGRLKTGTPARLDRASIDYGQCEEQPGDAEPYPFSFLTETVSAPQVSCWITWTTAETHRIIRENLPQCPMYSGRIEGRGPRYCPSIEDKVVRFADKDRHQIFLEPEGVDDPTIYPNGISTSYGEDVQEQIIRSIPGLQGVGIKQWAYAIEYDFVDPRALDPNLMLRAMPGLFLAGQINGTTGYEEAAGQGLVAGLNAARLVGGQDLRSFDRALSYIGVMIDDLTTRGATEPYRMFTSRAEYRLRLRADNADLRLTSLGVELGLVGVERRERFGARRAALEAAMHRALTETVSPTVAQRAGVVVKQDGRARTALDLLAQPGLTDNVLAALFPWLMDVDRQTREQLQIEALYAGYIERQEADVVALRRDEALVIPAELDFLDVGGLSNEAREKLAAVRPVTIAQAARIEGLTAGALTALVAHIRSGRTRADLRASGVRA